MRSWQQLVEQIQQVWAGMSVPGRFGFVLMAAVCLAAIGGISYWAAQPDYRALFVGLTPEDAGAITAKLDTKGIPYRLAAGGSEVLVPVERLNQARLDLAADGLPAGGVKGFDKLDSPSIGMTPTLEHILYTRALESELTKTIQKVEPVSWARVHLVRPDESPFIRDRKPTTASVFLKLKPGATLSRSAAAGIVALVARSVEGLTPENITIIDNTGQVLSETRGRDAGAAASTNFEYRRQYESHLASAAEEMLAKVLGPGRAVVRVSAELNFKTERNTSKKYDPDGRVVKKETVTSKSNTSSTKGKGPAGAASNLGKQPLVDTSGSGVGTKEEIAESDYLVSETIQELEEAVGNIERLTVAAAVQLAAESETGDAEPLMTLEEVEEIIKQAVGFKKGRDEIKVSEVRMAPSPLDRMESGWLESQRWESYVGIARNTSLGVASLVALLLGRMILKRFRPETPPAPPDTQLQKEEVSAIELLTHRAKQNPEAVAELLKQWLDETEENRRRAA